MAEDFLTKQEVRGRHNIKNRTFKDEFHYEDNPYNKKTRCYDEQDDSLYDDLDDLLPDVDWKKLIR